MSNMSDIDSAIDSATGDVGGLRKLDLLQQDIERDLPEDVDVFKIDDETTMLYKIVSLSNVSGFDGIPKENTVKPLQQLLLVCKEILPLYPDRIIFRLLFYLTSWKQSNQCFNVYSFCLFDSQTCVF